MTVFNRMWMTVLGLVLLAAGIAVIALTWSIPNDTIAWLRDATDWMGRHNQDTEKALLSLIAGVVAFLGLVLVLLELLPDNGDVRVTDLRVGGAVLSTADISQRVEEAVRGVEHVVNVKSAIKAKRKGVAVLLNLDVDPDANLALVTDEACEAASDVLRNKVHVALAEPPQARLHYRELRFKSRKEPEVVTPVVVEEDPKEAVMRIAAAPPPDVPPASIAEVPAVEQHHTLDKEPVPLTSASAPAEERPHETTPST